MKKITIILLLLVLTVCIVAKPNTSNAEVQLDVTSKEAILMSENGDVVFERNSREKRPIASMTKIMTLLCAYDAIDNGKVSLNDEVLVSARASSMGGSQVFLDANSKYKMEELIKSIVICSANDSCVAVAEHVSGSVEAFVKQMNDKAQQLQLVATHFENCTGLPHVSQFSCAYDVATMFRQLIKHPHYFTCANIWMQDFVHPSGRITGMSNTNKLIRFYDGCDAGKTGYTCEAQHCLCATAKRNDTRVIAVVVGAPDSKTRFAEVSNMFNYAFANYENKVFLARGQKITCDNISCGKQKSISVTPQNELSVFVGKGIGSYKVVYQFDKKICAPIKVGQIVGVAKLVDESNNEVDVTNLVSCNDVQQKSVWDYFVEIITNK